MCLGVPGQIVSVVDGALMRMGTVNLGGVTREVCLAYVPEAEAGDYVIIHAGFAISQLDETAARDTLEFIESAASPQQ
jgi:hydrogenase expression/formation protein HypC